MRLRQALPFLTLISLAGCGFFGGGEDQTDTSAPTITSFTASPGTIATPGESVTLNWTVAGPVTGLEIDQGVGQVSGTSQTVNPVVTTTYTLTASNSAGESRKSTEVTVTDTTTPPPIQPPTGSDVTDPTGTFGVSDSPTGPFDNDAGNNIISPDDDRVLNLEPGDTFYAQVQYEDPSGIADIIVRLYNRSPAGLSGDLVRGVDVGGFTLVGPVSNCNLAARPTSVNCIFEIQVGDDVLNIDQLPGVTNEFAYVFRTRVTDGAGNLSDTPPRGYVTVGDAGSGTPPPTSPPPTPIPEPDDNEAPTAAFDISLDGEGSLSYTFDGSRSSDPDDDELSYAWDFGDDTETDTTSGVSADHTFEETGTYDVELTVTDPDGESGSRTEVVVVEDDSADE